MNGTGNTKQNSLVTIICGVTIIFLTVGTLEKLPYGYYTFLRLVTCLSAGFLAWEARNHSTVFTPVIVVLFGLICLLYNPVIIVHLSRAEWLPINIATEILFALGALVFRRRMDESAS